VLWALVIEDEIRRGELHEDVDGCRCTVSEEPVHRERIYSGAARTGAESRSAGCGEATVLHMHMEAPRRRDASQIKILQRRG